MTFERMKYVVKCFDVMTMKGYEKTIYEIYSDGKILMQHHMPGERKADYKCEYSVSVSRLERLCEDIEQCIHTAEQLEWFIDDTASELTIYHKFGRVEVLPRGFANGNTHIGEIMDNFINENAQK